MRRHDDDVRHSRTSLFRVPRLLLPAYPDRHLLVASGHDRSRWHILTPCGVTHPAEADHRTNMAGGRTPATVGRDPAHAIGGSTRTADPGPNPQSLERLFAGASIARRCSIPPVLAQDAGPAHHDLREQRFLPLPSFARSVFDLLAGGKMLLTTAPDRAGMVAAFARILARSKPWELKPRTSCESACAGAKYCASVAARSSPSATVETVGSLSDLASVLIMHGLQIVDKGSQELQHGNMMHNARIARMGTEFVVIGIGRSWAR